MMDARPAIRWNSVSKYICELIIYINIDAEHVNQKKFWFFFCFKQLFLWPATENDEKEQKIYKNN
jgi:hypothetical protein